MKKTRLCAVLIIGFSLMLCGCAKKAQETGFLSTYQNLEPVSSNLMRYYSQVLVARYSKFIIDPITVKFYDEETAKKVSHDDIMHMQNYFYTEIIKKMPVRYQLALSPGPGVARIRIALTNLEKSNPLLNVIPQTKLMGLGLGQASVEMEAVDSQLGVQLAAAIDSETGSRFSFDGLSKWGDAEAVMRDWSKRIWLRVDEAHGIKVQ
jgi:hypothetical protein